MTLKSKLHFINLFFELIKAEKVFLSRLWAHEPWREYE